MPVPPILDKTAHRAQLARALRRNAPGMDFLARQAAGDIMERLDVVDRRFELAAIAEPGDTLAEMLARSSKAATTVRLCGFAGDCGRGDLPGLVGDEESLPFAPESLDLFVSVLSLHWANDLPGALVQIRRALRPDGLFLAAMLGGDTLTELRQTLAEAEAEVRGGASPRVLPFADVRDLGALLQRAGFALPVADRDVLTVRYDSAFHLMRDLRGMGAANVLVERDRRPPPRRLFLRAAEIYADRFADPDGRVRATFEVVSLSGWAPHEGQQKPARRGSATVSLADVLGKGRSRTV
ncbi:methyltransferase domain-containing protein [Faunimonas sp. B44]|uniref:methyltransferase domain-containing protein n=1 Tax=Faunimonas sp. B44 TaxID=3461493 RepID=UPI004044A0C3